MLKLLMGRPYIVLCPLDFVGVAPNLVRPAAAEGVSFGCLCAPCVVVETTQQHVREDLQDRHDDVFLAQWNLLQKKWGAGHAWFILDARQCNFASSFMAKQNNACSPCFPHMLMSKSTLLMVK